MTDSDNSVKDAPVLKYFLDRNGQETRRIAGKPGSGHIEIAVSAEKLDPTQDIYQQMFALGYARVIETSAEIHIEAPRALTKRQRRTIEDRHLATKKPVLVNSQYALESKNEALAAKLVETAVAAALANSPA